MYVDIVISNVCNSNKHFFSKVTVEIQDGWRKDAKGIRNVKKHF